jgi:hypothetical protein
MTGFTIPDYVNATFPEQAAPDSVDFDALVAAFNAAGVVSGLAVTTSSLMTLAVSAGSAWFPTSTASYAGGTVTIGTANGSNPRIDLVTLSSAGSAVVTAGTAAAHPVFPLIPANSALLAAVWVDTAVTTIVSGAIIDKRIIGVKPVPAGGTGAGTFTNHGIIVGQGSNTFVALPAGTGGQVLTSGGASADPTWAGAAESVVGLILARQFFT